VRGSSCLGAVAHCVQDDSADFGMYVSRNMKAQYAATKAINYPARGKVLEDAMPVKWPACV
jgi:hypothetical protein